MRTSRRYQLRILEPLASELEAFADQRGLGVCPAIRLLIRRGLDRDEENRLCRECAAAAAGLIAAEQTLLVVASILPQGRSLVANLASEAAAAAEQRLALFEPPSPGDEVTP